MQPSFAADGEVTANQVVEALEGTFGVTPGQRRNHIKGSCAIGEFVGKKEAVRYSRSPLFSGKPVPVVARFSLAGGNPKIPDTAMNPRGLALEFKIPGGKLHHMAMLNTPMFGAASTQTFLDLTLATRRPESLTRKRSRHLEPVTRTMPPKRSFWRATIHRRAMRTALSTAFTPSSSSASQTRSHLSAGNSFRRMAKSGCRTTNSRAPAPISLNRH